MNESQSKPVILAVDDTPENLDVVKGILASEYSVKAAINGPIALKIAEKHRPDLILLDVMMPGMDGYEVCQKLKENPKTRDIPVIFVTAMDQTSDETRGFSLGAADYIFKPVIPPILQARVKTHLALKQSMDELSEAYGIIKQQKDRMEEELNIGRDIQMSMLPLEFPQRDEFSVHALLQPAREVGGDFYDFFFINEDELVLVVGDVSGKGVPAALFMAVTKSVIKTRAMDDPSPASIVTRVNDEMSQDNPSSMFVTLFIAICNIRTGECRFTNAGHNPPYIRRRDGKLEILSQRHGPIIGAMEDLAYKESSVDLGMGDQLFIFTDGVTEAMDKEDNLFSEKRLEDHLESSMGSSVEDLVSDTLLSVEKYADGAEQADDITMLACSLLKEPDKSEYPRMSLVISSDFQEIGRLNKELARFARKNDLPEDVMRKLNIAIDDLVNNIISYGTDEDGKQFIEINCAYLDNRLMLEVVDTGKPFNPFEQLNPDTTSSIEDRKIGGLGRLLVKELMDDVDYERQKDRNVVKLIMDIP
ncbi:MAG: SpoIIE family protein phosphatase [Xanthomonadales bacterium]|jgi:sigma-B regulation protein RsbU (phosphoserine phosphatase)|nr:SpoIIE family protein phosphatase [Xanthomonadales bacterium]MDH3939990.1 SpoIIE family protein phosphatase [Xanthomonadales bacterium]MDH4001914.1 SpoIIE family protein phosphatase [Xanthomonadales bacterium]